MRIVRGLFLMTLAALTGLAGCESTGQQVRPPKPEEEFRAPPENDPRYSRPMEYPKESLEQDMLLKKARDAAKGIPAGPNGMRPGRPGGF